MPIIRTTKPFRARSLNMRCPNCKSDTFVEINMTLGEKEVAFRRCGRCETQKWESEDKDVDLRAVLKYAKDLTV